MWPYVSSPSRKPSIKLWLSCPSRTVTLPENLSNEKRAQGLDISCRLLSFSHILYDPGKGIEALTHQSDHKFIVISIEPVTCQADIVGEPGTAIRDADSSVFQENFILLLLREQLEFRFPTQRTTRLPTEIRGSKRSGGVWPGASPPCPARVRLNMSCRSSSVPVFVSEIQKYCLQAGTSPQL